MTRKRRLYLLRPAAPPGALALACLIAGALVVAGCAVAPPSPEPGVPVATARPGEAPTGSEQAHDDAVALDDDPLFRLLVAEFAGQRGHLDVAVGQYLELARARPEPLVAKRATKIAVFARDDAAALESAKIWVDAAPSDLEARQIIAAMYIRHGDADSALAHLEYVLSQDEQNAGRKLRMIASLLGREEDQQVALVVMEKLVAERQNDPDALLAYAMLSIRAEQLDKARGIMEKIVGQAEISPSIAMAYLTVLQKQGLVQEAIDWLDHVLEEAPDNFGLRMIYARLLADANRYEEARMQFVILAGQAPDNTDVVYALALLNLQGNRVDDAEQNFERLAKSAERRDDAYYYLGQIAESRQQLDRAIERYRSMVRGGNYFHAQVRIALILSTQAKVDLARKHLHEIIPASAEQELQLVRAEGEILTEHELYEDAMAVYDAALADAYDTDLVYTRAMLAEKMGRLEALERDLRMIIEREPDNAQALNALGYTLANRTERYHEAHELITRALEISPNDFYILDSMGWVLYRLGRLEDSIPFLERAREIRNDPEVAAHLGEVLWVLGDRDRARTVWESVLQDRPNDKTLLDVIERLTP